MDDRLFVTDQRSGLVFFISTSSVSLIDYDSIQNNIRPDEMTPTSGLQLDSHGKRFNVLGQIERNIDIGLERPLAFKFFVVQGSGVNVIGKDFLKEHRMRLSFDQGEMKLISQKGTEINLTEVLLSSNIPDLIAFRLV